MLTEFILLLSSINAIPMGLPFSKSAAVSSTSSLGMQRYVDSLIGTPANVKPLISIDTSAPNQAPHIPQAAIQRSLAPSAVGLEAGTQSELNVATLTDVYGIAKNRGSSSRRTPISVLPTIAEQPVFASNVHIPPYMLSENPWPKPFHELISE